MANKYVYALFRPDTGQIFYIGMGQGKRAWDHVVKRCRGKSYKDNLICNLIDVLGYPDIPVVIVRNGLTRQEAADLERALIFAVGRHPHGPLTNLCAGGEGGFDPHPETRAKMSAARKGKQISLEQRAKISAFQKGRQKPSEMGVKLSAAKKGKSRPPFSPEWRAKIGASQKGRVVSAEAKEKIGSAHRGKIVSPETRAKISAARKGKPLSPESIAKRSATVTGTTRSPHSPETKAKISAARKLRFSLLKAEDTRA